MYLSLFLALDPLKVIKLLSSHSPIVTMASAETLFSTLSLLNVPNFIVFSMETIKKGINCYINCSGGNLTQFTIFTIRAHCWKCDVAGLRIKRKHHEIQTAGVGQPLASTRVHPTTGIHGDQKTLLNAPGIGNTEGTTADAGGESEINFIFHSHCYNFKFCTECVIMYSSPENTSINALVAPCTLQGWTKKCIKYEELKHDFFNTIPSFQSKLMDSAGK